MFKELYEHEHVIKITDFLHLKKSPIIDLPNTPLFCIVILFALCTYLSFTVSVIGHVPVYMLLFN